MNKEAMLLKLSRKWKLNNYGKVPIFLKHGDSFLNDNEFADDFEYEISKAAIEYGFDVTPEEIANYAFIINTENMEKKQLMDFCSEYPEI